MPTLSEAEYAYYTANSGGATAVITSTTLAAGTSVVIFPAAPRVGGTVYNGTGQTVYLAFGPTASATAFTVPLLAGAYFEIPFRYKGAVSAFSATASASPHLVATNITA